MKIDLTEEELYILSESLKYSKLKIEGMPIGIEGYPNYDMKKTKLKGIDDLIQKLNVLKKSI